MIPTIQIGIKAMGIKSYRNVTSKKKYLILRDKIKYYLNIRKLSLESNEVDRITSSIAIKKEVNGVKQNGGDKLKFFIKNIKKILPEVVMFNALTGFFYTLLGNLVDTQEKKIRSRIKSKLILFDCILPDSFDLPIPSIVPIVSIIIPVHNKYDFTHRCLFAIKEHSIGIDFEVIIADDSSTDQTLEIKNNVKNKIGRAHV